MLRILASALLWLGTAFCLPAAHAGSVLDRIRKTGSLACGTLAPPDDYTLDDTHGAVPGFDAAICRAVSAAILGQAAPATVHAYPDERHAFTALAASTDDLLVGASPSLTAARLYHVVFGPPVLIDGQSFMVNRRDALDTPDDLEGRTVCAMTGTQSQGDTDRYLRHRGVKYLPFPFTENGEMEAALVTGRCKAMAGSLTQLAAARSRFKGRRPDFAIWPDAFTVDPIAPASPASDPEFAAIVRWTVAVLLRAEESGYTRALAAGPATPTEDPALQVFSGIDPTLALGLGLPRDWAGTVVRTTGNYAELFDRTLGGASGLGLARGRSALWSAGGLLFAPPMR